MIDNIIKFSIHNKFIVLLMTFAVIIWGGYSLTQISIGAVPDITNNQVQVMTTSRNLATEDVEQFITYPIELEMSNLPGVKEIRSISKFGLSVVTIVFDEEMGTYLPRQLISEKLRATKSSIPESFGVPELGPITTGLGEIYQYLLEPKEGYEDQYSTMELRTIQDWVVKRQLSGIRGVVEVNTWGGFLKQYEVAVTPMKLKSMNISISEIFKALQTNNDITGGGYIEKLQKSYFIRGEGTVKSISDIENIVVKNRNGIPILVKDVAKVQLGKATRFGAITANGKGEVIMGQVMMLKGANSKKVIAAVKERVAEVQKTLPEGLHINPFLERTELIDKTTHTVGENLILGALIVIFVLILLLGNWRSGLIVASVIPICLLFSISLMNVFGIGANLMSLGAIDFGIIIDGAVIIVEYVVFSMTSRQSELEGLTGKKLQQMKDKITFSSSSQMMRSAIFGQIIILIVFIPILTLSDVEGKMFRPMALAFSFAIIGAMLLCLTYVPVLVALFAQAEKETSKKNISHRMMNFFQEMYAPVIRFALRQKAVVLGFAAILLVGSGIVFARMGGEFIPTLDEGDFVIQPILKPGVSLSRTIELCTKMEQILLENFPEVTQVASRIGAAEVPTDPMSMEMADVMVKLKPRSEWTTTSDKDELADKMKIALEVIPNIEYEFTQPIEMRFNELITGVRSDVAIKIYGEDLKILDQKATQVEKLIKNVNGVADISIEKVTGLPQMSVKYNRQRIAQYGLNIQDLNNTISMAFAGLEAGTVFEGERRFALVIRFEESERKSIEALQNLYIDLPNSDSQIPLKEVATIDYSSGPAQISRDDTYRRIVIGINVRNTDVETMVSEIQQILGENLKLPIGYHITYGGQFENLQNAKARLKIAVPLVLVLIFILLYFTFNDFKQALLVFTAIPLATIGGVGLLWIRDLPFSISAGVGFIALFGIAVLNGIVLIDFFNELKREGLEDIKERILLGTKMRLRPVLLTASAAAMGFFPMAFSNSAGAEVQRPLATVVIGGLISATFLTLVVLPVLYAIFFKNEGNQQTEDSENTTSSYNLNSFLVIGLLGFGLLFSQKSIAQTLTPQGAYGSEPIYKQGNTFIKANTLIINSFEAAFEIALANNSSLKVSELETSKQKILEGTAVDLGKTSFYFNKDANNLTNSNNALKVWGIQQDFSLPSVYKSRKEGQKIKTILSEQMYKLSVLKLKKATQSAFYQLIYQTAKQKTLLSLDSTYANFARIANIKYQTGESNFIEKLTAQSKQEEIRLLRQESEGDILIATENLKAILQTDNFLKIIVPNLEKMLLPLSESETHLEKTIYFEAQQYLDTANISIAKKQLLPDFNLEYFVGTTPNEKQNYQGFQIGVSLPIWRKSAKSKISAAKVQADISVHRKALYLKHRNAKINQLKSQFNKHQQSLNYFEKTGLQLAEELQRMASKSYKEGETSYLEYIQSIENALRIKLKYLQNLNDYNQVVIELSNN